MDYVNFFFNPLPLLVADDGTPWTNLIQLFLLLHMPVVYSLLCCRSSFYIHLFSVFTAFFHHVPTFLLVIWSYPLRFTWPNHCLLIIRTVIWIQYTIFRYLTCVEKQLVNSRIRLCHTTSEKKQWNNRTANKRNYKTFRESVRSVRTVQ